MMCDKHVVRGYCFVIYTALQFPYVILCPNLMTVQTSQGKVRQIYKELIQKILTFEYEMLLAVKVNTK